MAVPFFLGFSLSTLFLYFLLHHALHLSQTRAPLSPTRH